MKGTIIWLFVIIIFNIGFKAQLDPVKFKLEKNTFKYSLNSEFINLGFWSLC